MFNPKEYKVVALRECPMPTDLCDTPARAADYWRKHIPSAHYFNPEVETLVVLLLNTRQKAKGHALVSMGTMDTILAHPREIFRPAIVAASATIVLMHNHPSGDPTPSQGDIRVTREIFRAGQLLKIDLLDHVIMGQNNPDTLRDFTSLRELGYFYH